MFEEMSCTVCFFSFSSGTCINPYSNSRCLRPWRMFCCNLSPNQHSTTPISLCHTVKPFDNVVDSVRAGVTGLAYLRNGATELSALLTRPIWCKRPASLCDILKRPGECRARSRKGKWLMMSLLSIQRFEFSGFIQLKLF